MAGHHKSNNCKKTGKENTTVDASDQIKKSETHGARIDMEEDRLSSRNITKLLSKARAVVKDDRNSLTLKSNLIRKITLLGDMYKSKLDLEDEMQQMILDVWIEEILRFLALKAIMNDTVEPYQIIPGYIVAEGWKALMLSASVYSKICKSMGHTIVFDHNPQDTDPPREIVPQIIHRYNFTLRSYFKYFEQEPTHIYWKIRENKLKNKKEDKEDDMISSMGKLCGFNASFLPFHSDGDRRMKSKICSITPSTE